MSIALYSAASGMHAAKLKIDTIANNIANADSTAYKAMSVQNTDLFYHTVKSVHAVENTNATQRPVGVYVGGGTKSVGTSRNLTQGPLQDTGRTLDIAIVGSGYFAITLPNGRVGYTRDGSFKRSVNGSLVTFDGNEMEDNILIPDNIDTSKISIRANGLITTPDPDNPQNEPMILGQLRLFSFINDQGLEPFGNNTFVETASSGEPIEIDDLEYKFQQGFLEGSNVESIKELTQLIETQRWYEACSKIITTEDEISNETNKIKK